MIQGYCLGGGLGFANMCDMRLASENSRFSIPAARLGLGYGWAGVKKLVDLVGPSFAKEIFLTARQFNAAEALGDGPHQPRPARRRDRSLYPLLLRHDRARTRR